MIIDCISDLHGHLPQLEGGDLLIVAGDLTATDSVLDHMRFQMWMHEQDYKKRIIIAGNHDNRLQQLPFESVKRQYAETGEDYLCDSGTEFEYEVEVPHPASTEHVRVDVLMYEHRKLKIWGSPWTLRFEGMNPNCMAFTCDTEEELAEKWALIPHDTDILVTHSPPYGIADKNIKKEKCGSKSLYERLIKVKPRIHIFGHIHESGYKHFEIKYPLEIEQFPSDLIRVGYHITHCINASHVNENYEPVNKPIRITL